MKRSLSFLMAVAVVACMWVTARAADAYYSHGDLTLSRYGLVFDEVRPDSTYYIPVEDLDSSITFTKRDGTTYQVKDSGENANAINKLGDGSLFSFKASKKGEGRSLIKSVELVNGKNLGGSTPDKRTAYLKVTTGSTHEAGEKKATVEVTFKPRKYVNAGDLATSVYKDILVDNGVSVDTYDTAEYELTFWISNDEMSGSSADAEAGDGFIFKPESNDENYISWGEMATLRFDASSEASKFYAKLSTKADSEIYRKYADPVGAELWFYTFVGAPTVPSTSRATLTLGVPWNTDSDNALNPKHVYIYTRNPDGTLSDITSEFTYYENWDDIEGWSIKTRKLTNYIVSDTELDLDAVQDEVIEKVSLKKPVPSTGGSDMVTAAILGGIGTLAAAGAVAFKKVSR